MITPHLTYVTSCTTCCETFFCALLDCEMLFNQWLWAVFK